MLSRTAARFPDRDALVVCHQNVRLTWRELDREVTRTARGLAGLGLRPRRPHRHLVQQLPGMDPPAVRFVARRSDPGQRQSGLPLARAALRAAQVAHPGAVAAGTRFAGQLPRDPAGIAQWRQPAPGTRDLAGRGLVGCHDRGRRRPRRGRRQPPTTSPISSTPRGPPDRPKASCSPTTTCSTTAWRSGWRCGHRGGPHLRARAAVPLLRIGDRLAGGASERRGADPAFGAVRRSGHTPTPSTDERATALYGVPTMFIAELEHPEFAEFRSLRRCARASCPERPVRSS